jgi:RNA polymerase sigma-70 factor (ECF subfamily)
MTDNFVNHGDGSPTSTNFIQQIRDREELAWVRLVKVYGPLIAQWCGRYRLQASDIEDIMQEVFRAVFRSIKDFKRTPGSVGKFRGWLWTIASNKIIDLWKRRRAEAALVECWPVEPGLESIPEETESEQVLILNRVLGIIRGEFSERVWEAFWRSVALDRPPATVAEELVIPLNSVYLARSRVLRRLRELIRELGGFSPGLFGDE